MKPFRMQQMWLAMLTAILLVAGAAGLVEAKPLKVANNGIDSPTCGDKNNPCRSISQAIANASDGDKIVVGPGLYGDLNGDGTFDTTVGEEKAEVGMGCFCMIKVDKQLSIESRDGASATVLDGGKELSAVVGIFASNVVFGKKKKGFTLTHGNLGMYINFGTSEVRVEGNLVSANGSLGFRIHGNGHALSNNLAVADGLTGFELNDSGLVLNGNQAIANNIGFVLNGNGHQLQGNIAYANNDTGFAMGGSGHHFSSNVASANGTGFDVTFGVGDSDVFTGNLAYGNRFHGFFIETGTGYVLTGNSILGNKGAGIFLSDGTGATITKNNIYGNADALSFPGTNCGLINDSGNTIDATNNFWGAATGPGANPADGAGNIFCDGGIKSTTVHPAAIQEFKIKTSR